MRTVSTAPHGAPLSEMRGEVPGEFAGITVVYLYTNRLLPHFRFAYKEGAPPAERAIMSFTYGYFANGLLSTLVNNLSPDATQNYTYDELNRLKTAASQTSDPENVHCWGQSYSYDRYANLTAISVTKCTAPSLSLSINQNNRITNPGFSYDAAGNMTQDGTGAGTHTYQWEAEGRLKSVDDGATATYTYDGDGQRVKKSTGTLYWYGTRGEVLAESDLSGNNLRECIYYQGERIARRDDATGAVYYLFADRLGSAWVVTDAQGYYKDIRHYYPYGGIHHSHNWGVDNPYQFTGMERDSETGLDHTLFRQYSSTLARWLSPDPLLNSGKPWQPQSWNRYVYALNNPLKFTDPTGLYNLVNNCAQDDERCNREFNENAKRLRQALQDPQKKVAKVKDPT